MKPTVHQGVPEVLCVDQVGVTLAGRRILKDVSFVVHPGEFTGLIGSNGAGKTTLLRVILGLQRPTTGRVSVTGRSRRHRSVGYVPQKVMLDRDMPLRARDLVELGIDGHRFGLPTPSKARRIRVEELLAAVGAESFANARVGLLSGGEQQRILIAHALAGQPTLLLLDEPLANLDLLHRLARDHGVAILLSAHEMNPLLPVMDRIVYLAEGRAATGTTKEVVRSEVLSNLYGHHVDVINIHGRVLVIVGDGHDDNRPVPSHPPIEVA
jgi:zinc/manganese transport system ATP-binding protein